MNILFLSTENPFPEDHGHHIRTANVLKFLSRKHRIHFVGFAKSANELTCHPELDKLCITVNIFQAPFSRNRLLLAKILLKSVVLGVPFTAYRYFDERVADRITQILDREKIDLIHIDMLHLAVYEKQLRVKPAILTNHNVEFLRLQRWMKVENRIWLKLFLGLQYRLMRRFERKIFASFAHCIAVSEYDRQILEKLSGNSQIVVVPNGVDTNYFSPTPVAHQFKTLVWVGAMTNAYNQDAVEYFVRDVWPLVKSSLSDVRAVFVGADPPEVLRRSADRDSGITLLGYLEDVRPFMSLPSIFIAPLLSGSGTKIKVLNAMAMGMPVITTPVGAEGLEIRHGVDVLIANDPDDFAAQAVKLWNSPELAREIGANGRRTVQAKYDWKVVFQKMEHLYDSVAQERRQERGTENIRSYSLAL